MDLGRWIFIESYIKGYVKEYTQVRENIIKELKETPMDADTEEKLKKWISRDLVEDLTKSLLEESETGFTKEEEAIRAIKDYAPELFK